MGIQPVGHRFEFAPDLVIVSAGFDSAAGDPKGGMTLLELAPVPSWHGVQYKPAD